MSDSTDTAPQGAALPTPPSLPARILLITATILGTNPIRTLTQDGLDSAFTAAATHTAQRLTTEAAEDATFQARAKLPTVSAGTEHHEYAAALRLTAGTL